MTQKSTGKLAPVVQLRRESQNTAQLPLLPLRVQADVPSRRRSADMKTFVRTIDGHDYATKTTDDHPLLPASEYLCYRIAAACNLPVPYSQVINIGSGQFAFGSRVEGSVTEWAAMGPGLQLQAFRDAAEAVSAILAFDLFIGNVDRHRGNFLFRKNQSGHWAPLAIDYSRALLVKGFPNDRFPMPVGENTQVTIALMKNAGFWKGPYAVFSLESMRDITQDHIDHWFKEIPVAWLSDEQRGSFLAWWKSPAFLERMTSTFRLL
jgi:hypothetical protein